MQRVVLCFFLHTVVAFSVHSVPHNGNVDSALSDWPGVFYSATRTTGVASPHHRTATARPKVL
jgi:hypothetical protein